MSVCVCVSIFFGKCKECKSIINSIADTRIGYLLITHEYY